MLKMKTIICIVAIIITTKLAHAEPFEFKYATKDDYSASMMALRIALSRELPNVPNIRSLPGSPAEATMLVRLREENGGKLVYLVLMRQNLYIAGFVTGGFFFRFADEAMEQLTVPGTQTVNLRMGSDYISLERNAHRTRSDVRVGQATINQAVIDLYNYGSGSTQEQAARALLTLIIGVAESARFNTISRFIDDHYDSPVEIGTQLERLTNQWQVYSGYAQQMSEGASRDDNYWSDTFYSFFNVFTLSRILALALTCDTPLQFPEADDTRQYLPVTDTCPAVPVITKINKTFWPNNVLINSIL